jgi:predicted metal-dependent phosphoesterase TrpH
MISEYILNSNTSVLSKRDPLKDWWNSKLAHITDWKLLEEWVQDRPAEVASFQAAFDVAVGKVAARKLA